MDSKQIRGIAEAYSKVYQNQSDEQYEIESDIILSYVLDEGYAETDEEATEFIENMSDEWIDEILTERRGAAIANRNTFTPSGSQGARRGAAPVRSSVPTRTGGTGGRGVAPTPGSKPPSRPAPTAPRPAPVAPRPAAAASKPTPSAKPATKAPTAPVATKPTTSAASPKSQVDSLKAMRARSLARQGKTTSSTAVSASRSTAFKEDYDTYDIILEYLMFNGHAETIEEANYVMLEMEPDTIADIVEELSATIDPQKHKAAQKTQKIYNLGKGSSNPNESKSALSKSGPQLPGV